MFGPRARAALLSDNPNFVWLRASGRRRFVAEAGLASCAGRDHEVREYRRNLSAGRGGSARRRFHRRRGQGQEGVELAFQFRPRRPGRAPAASIKDRLGRVIEDVGEGRPRPSTACDIRLSIDASVQFEAWQKLRAAVSAHKAKAGSVVVLDVRTGEVLALANGP